MAHHILVSEVDASEAIDEESQPTSEQEVGDVWLAVSQREIPERLQQRSVAHGNTQGEELAVQ